METEILEFIQRLLLRMGQKFRLRTLVCGLVDSQLKTQFRKIPLSKLAVQSSTNAPLF